MIRVGWNGENKEVVFFAHRRHHTSVVPRAMHMAIQGLECVTVRSHSAEQPGFSGIVARGQRALIARKRAQNYCV